MPETSYAPPLDSLLTYTNDVDRMRGPWPDYVGELGLTREHAPDLARMVVDLAFWDADPDSSEIWANVHAWRALAQLGDERAVTAMLDLLVEDPDNDWALTELPEVAARVGPSAVPELKRTVEDEEATEDERNVAAEALRAIALRHDAAREPVITTLTEQLRHHGRNDASFNGFLVWFLIDLGAKESLPVIEAAYDANDVDVMICGDVNDALVAFGEEPRPIPAHDRALWELAKAQVMGEMMGARRLQAPSTVSVARTESPIVKAKAKSKRKAAKQARKKNRR